MELKNFERMTASFSATANKTGFAATFRELTETSVHGNKHD